MPNIIKNGRLFAYDMTNIFIQIFLYPLYIYIYIYIYIMSRTAGLSSPSSSYWLKGSQSSVIGSRAVEDHRYILDRGTVVEVRWTNRTPCDCWRNSDSFTPNIVVESKTKFSHLEISMFDFHTDRQWRKKTLCALFNWQSHFKLNFYLIRTKT